MTKGFFDCGSFFASPGVGLPGGFRRADEGPPVHLFGAKRRIPVFSRIPPGEAKTDARRNPNTSSFRA
jgi:hypothetical protein